MNKLVLSSLLSAITFLAGCAPKEQAKPNVTNTSSGTPQQSSDDPSGVTIAKDPFPQDKNSRLVFFSANNAYKNIAISGNMPSLADAKVAFSFDGSPDSAYKSLAESDDQNGVWALCGGKKPAPTVPNNRLGYLFPLGATIVGWGIEKLATWLVDEASDEVQKKVDEYTITYSSSSNAVDFYQTLSNGHGLALNGKEKPQVACYRYSVRGPIDPTKDSNPTLLLDFIGSIHYYPSDPRSVTLRPVRIYVRRVTALSSDNTTTVQIKLSGTTSTLVPGGVQYSNDALNTTVFVAKVDTTNIDKQPFYQVYDDSASSVRVPLPNWDASSGATKALSNEMNFTISVTEIGKVNVFLDELNKLLSKNKDTASKDLNDALDKWAKSAFKIKSFPKA